MRRRGGEYPVLSYTENHRSGKWVQSVRMLPVLGVPHSHSKICRVCKNVPYWHRGTRVDFRCAKHFYPIPIPLHQWTMVEYVGDEKLDIEIRTLKSKTVKGTSVTVFMTGIGS